MKKAFVVLSGFMLLVSCSNNGGESGAVNDGIKPVDTNGGLPDTGAMQASPKIDTTKGEHRVDLERRDTSTIPEMKSTNPKPPTK
jgi:hypothetical protein